MRLFTFQAMYAGLAPADALAIYAVITYMDCVSGVYFPEGGMHAVPTAMARVLGESGADLRYAAPVGEILRDASGRVAGVTAAGEKIAADAVVITLDLPTAYAELLSDLTPPRSTRNPTYSPSCLVWHVGVRGAPPAGAAHHNIHFADAWAESFEQLISRKQLMTDPSRFVTIPSLDAPAMAAEGHSALYALEPVPNLSGDVDWTRNAARAERLHRFPATQGYPDDVVTERSDPGGLGRRGWPPGRPSAWRTPSSRPGLPAAQRRPRVPGSLRRQRTTPGSGCRWC